MYTVRIWSLEQKAGILPMLTLMLFLWSEVASAYRTKHIPSIKKYAKGAVATNGVGCAEAGIEIMKKGGTAVDVALATLFCEGVAMPSTMGLGGGFFMVIYKKNSREVYTLDSRETAPRAATEDMFSGHPELSQSGGLSVAVPGELRGYWEAYKKFGGGVPWKDLPKNAIKQCQSGIFVNAFQEKMMSLSKEALYADPGMRKDFINPITNDTRKEGDYYKRPKLAQTLQIIAREGGEALHNGSLTKAFVKDIQEKGGIITVEDMASYRPKWKKPVHGKYRDMELYSLPTPSSGPLVLYMLNIMEGFLDLVHPFSLTNYQRRAETFKFAYGARTKLGDADYTDVKDILANISCKEYARHIRHKIRDNTTSQDPEYYGAYSGNSEDYGTAQISVLAPNGDAVSVTSSINYIFGAKFLSASTGIILNDSMDDFSSPGETNQFGLPASPSNYIVPGKRPMSSMCPSIILDKNKDVSLVIGGAGGSRITSNVVEVIVNHVWFKMDLVNASDEERIHHQLIPMTLYMENDFLQNRINIVEGLEKIGHNLTFVEPDGFAAVTCIAKNEDRSIVGAYDKRRKGSVAYVY
ncbi:hypothetical protein JTB14_004440 [Gonioctena quinquepunctata]|nr:hypothetical protein JTB14_004440 [Gonioctena quinquepunctata]